MCGVVCVVCGVRVCFVCVCVVGGVCVVGAVCVVGGVCVCGMWGMCVFCGCVCGRWLVCVVWWQQLWPADQGEGNREPLVLLRAA